MHARSLEQRLRVLERKNRILTSLLAGSAIVALLSAAARQEPPPLVLKAQRIELVDGSGQCRAELALRGSHPVLCLRDEKGRERLFLTHDDELTGMFIEDAAGDTRIDVAQYANGAGGVGLHGPESKRAAVLYLKGPGSLRFYDEDGEVIDEMPRPAGEGPAH